MNKLDVFIGDNRIGYVRRREDGQLAFAYDEDWIFTDSAQPITPLFPLQTEEYIGLQVSSYFDNLLPEGNVRNFIALALHIPQGNVVNLLDKFGKDTAGALVFLQPRVKPSDSLRYSPVSTEDVRTWITYTHGIPLNIPDENDNDNEEIQA